MKKREIHGLTSGKRMPPEYRIWASMIQRCHNPNDKDFYLYGGRGIIVCDEWRSSFKLFIEHVGWRPRPGLSLDRIDNSSGYEPNNVRWVDSIQQSRNKRNNIYVYSGEEKIILKDYCKMNNLKYKPIVDRIGRYGWSISDAISTPIRVKNNNV